MPKLTLKFNLPKEEYELKHAINGVKYLVIMQELYNEFRSKSKYGNDVGSWEDAYDLLKRVFNDNNFDPWEEV